MLPAWATILTSLGSGVIASLLTAFLQFWHNKQAHKNELERERIAFEREEGKEKTVYAREQLEAKKERMRQAGASIIVSAQKIYRLLNDARQIEVEHTPENIKDVGQPIPEYKTLAQPLRNVVDALEQNMALLKLELSNEEFPETQTGQNEIQTELFNLIMLMERGENIDYQSKDRLSLTRMHVQGFLFEFQKHIVKVLG